MIDPLTPVEVINVVLAVTILVLVAAIGLNHSHYRRWSHRTAFLGLTILALAVVNLVSALGNALVVEFVGIEWLDTFSFMAGLWRAVALILLVAYLLYRRDTRK